MVVAEAEGVDERDGVRAQLRDEPPRLGAHRLDLRAAHKPVLEELRRRVLDRDERVERTEALEGGTRRGREPRLLPRRRLREPRGEGGGDEELAVRARSRDRGVLVREESVIDAERARAGRELPHAARSPVRQDGDERLGVAEARALVQARTVAVRGEVGHHPREARRAVRRGSPLLQQKACRLQHQDVVLALVRHHRHVIRERVRKVGDAQKPVPSARDAARFDPVLRDPCAVRLEPRRRGVQLGKRRKVARSARALGKRRVAPPHRERCKVEGVARGDELEKRALNVAVVEHLHLERRMRHRVRLAPDGTVPNGDSRRLFQKERRFHDDVSTHEDHRSVRSLLHFRSGVLTRCRRQSYPGAFGGPRATVAAQ
mmetsp:Transcript_21333/g.69048  ORF Transcript_21333/g.69048 Transcript_21333/m.69048 type:complete len:374 (-) Transcript_21333:799-1920(-)